MRRSILLVLPVMFIASQAQSAIDMSKIEKVTGKSDQNCVEYYIYQGKSYCSTKAQGQIKVDPELIKKEMFQIKFDQRPWQAAWANEQDGSLTIEYLPAGDNINHWHELITSQFFPDIQDKITPYEYMNAQIAQLKKSGFKPKMTLHKETKGMVLFEYQIFKPKAQAQDELQKIVKGKDGYYLLHYVIKKSDMGDAERKKWIDNLMASHLMN